MRRTDERIVDLMLSALCFAALAMLLAAAPVRDLPNKVPKLPVGQTNWGTLVQSGSDGSKIVITGHPQWEAVGTARKDGTVHLLWTMNDGRSAPSVYKLDEEVLRGVWGWSNEVVHEEDGSLSGNLFGDMIKKDQ